MRRKTVNSGAYRMRLKESILLIAAAGAAVKVPGRGAKVLVVEDGLIE